MSKNGESSVIVVTMAALAVEEVMLLLLFSRSAESTLCDPMDCSTPGSSGLPEFAQIHVH